MSELMLQAESISFHYGSEPVLENVCLTASAGECVGIAGIWGMICSGRKDSLRN